jgi:hypothetical protein
VSDGPPAGITSTPHAEKEDEYTAYVVEYKQSGVEKAVVKRFSEFFTFDSFLRQRGFCCLPALPSRTLIKLFVDSFVQDRLRQLNEYVKFLSNKCYVCRFRVCAQACVCRVSGFFRSPQTVSHAMVHALSVVCIVLSTQILAAVNAST